MIAFAGDLPPQVAATRPAFPSAAWLLLPDAKSPLQHLHSVRAAHHHRGVQVEEQPVVDHAGEAFQ